MSRTLNLRGTFTEGETRNLNGRIIRNTSNPNPPPRVVTSNDFDRYINILRANNRFPIPKEQTLSISTTPYTLDKDLYLAKDSVISFSGVTSNIILFSLNMLNNDNKQSIDGNFIAGTYISLTQGRWTVIIVSIRDTYYEIVFNVYQINGSKVLPVPANSYYYTSLGSYDGNTPILTFYESINDPILSIASVSTNGTELYKNSDILISKSSFNFPFG